MEGDFRVSWEGKRGVKAGLVRMWFLEMRLKRD